MLIKEKMFGVITSSLPIILGCLITTLFVSISTNGRLSNYNHHSFTHSHHHKRQLMDQVLTDVNPLTEKIPIVNHGLPPLSSLVFNATVTKVCEQLEKVKSNQAEVLYAGALGYIASVDHYMSSSAALPTCVFRPATSSDVVEVMKMIEKEKVKFSVNSGKHTGNPYFSSTAGGLQIDMRKFTKIQLSNDHTEVDVGPGNVWENVYDKLQGTDRIVLGGRVSGVGVGGFLLGGGGYSYLTQKYGMAADSIVSMDIVVPNPARLLTISKDSYPDLFWAAKGGGNQFGVVINFKLKTFPISSTVWGGTRLYAGHGQKLKDASLQFVNEVNDKNAAAVLEFLYFGRIPLFAAEAFYDGAEPPNGTFDMFPSGGLLEPLSSSWGPGKMSNIVRSVPDNFTDDLRGYFNSVSLQKFTPGILKVALDELEKLNGDLLHSGMYFHIALEWAGKDYGAYAIGKDTSPFPYYKSPQPLELYFAWIDPLDDQFYHSAINEMANKIRAEATKEGQQVDDLPIYPNYAIDNTHAVNLFGQTNAVRMKSIKQKYDPDNTMRLTTWYAF